MNNKLSSDSVIIRPRRVFKCPHPEHQSFLFRKDVWKDKEGKYHCITDNALVEDYTNRETGKDLMEIINL